MPFSLLIRFRLFVFVLISGAVCAGCSELLYYPDHVMYVDIKTLDIAPQDVTFVTKNNDEIHAWYFSKLKEPKAIIVFFHGNGQNRSSHLRGLYWLAQEGYDLLAVDYPGYGDTDGEPTPQNTVATAEAALRFAVSKRPKTPLVVYGQSLGGAVALRAVINLKNEIKPALVVADSTFLSYKSAAQSMMARRWFTWILQPFTWIVIGDRYAPRDEVAKISPIPLLVIHSKEDEIIPFRLGQEVFDQAQGPKEFWPLEHGRHIGTFDLASGFESRKRFLQKLSSMGL